MQMGTPMYMSPEQITETKSVTAQSDIYSLGVILWQMVMGQKPYDTKTLSNFQLQNKIVNENLPLTNTNWDTSIQKATHKNQDSRYTSAQQFLNDLQNPKSIKDDKTIFENKEEATIIENNETQNINPKVEKSHGVIIALITGVVLLVIILIATSGPSQDENLAEQANRKQDSIAKIDSILSKVSNSSDENSANDFEQNKVKNNSLNNNSSKNNIQKTDLIIKKCETFPFEKGCINDKIR